jgi:hypothetical protein
VKVGREMAKTVAPATPPSTVTVIPAETADFSLTVEEFCTRLSQVDSRVELIGAFCWSERTAARYRDAESNYQFRFEAFANRAA